MTTKRMISMVRGIGFALPILLLFLALPAFSQTHWLRVETARYDWNRDGKPYTFVLDIPRNWDAGGDYSRLRILAPDGRRFTFASRNGLTTLADTFDPQWARPHLAALLKKNPVTSQHLLFLPVNSKSENPLLLFLFGWAYGSSPGSLHVIALDKGVPQQILYRKEFQLMDYLDLNGDGHFGIIGKRCLSQAWGAGLLTYDPYSVYTLSHGRTGPALLSISLSTKYNLEHYYGWAGPDCSEKLAVVLHPPGGGKPVIMDAKKAEKLTDGTSSPRK